MNEILHLIVDQRMFALLGRFMQQCRNKNRSRPFDRMPHSQWFKSRFFRIYVRAQLRIAPGITPDTGYRCFTIANIEVFTEFQGRDVFKQIVRSCVKFFETVDEFDMLVMENVHNPRLSEHLATTEQHKWVRDPRPEFPDYYLAFDKKYKRTAVSL